MDILTHQLIDAPRHLIVEQLQMLIHDIGVETHGWSCLGFLWREFMYLLSCSVNKRQHDLEWNLMTSEHFFRYGIAMVGEIAGKDCGQMQISPTVGVHFVYLAADSSREI